ncbi:MAG: hypothetical protein B6241_00760 [Spirochaetaceae bacterium 4572_59]|nr:MAG: hypothetical protein B6241_00760 [Spirochaetaceae bacterium 4572_59]
MTPLQAVFQFCSAVVSVYMLLIIFRVLLSWFQGRLNGRGVEILVKVTDPYLNAFKNITWLRFGFMDFSPVIAISLLGLVSQILSSLAITGHLNIGMVIAYIVGSVWSFVSFFADALILLMIFRLITVLFFSGWSHQLLFQLDNLLYKLVSRILGMFTSKNTKFSMALGISAVILLAARVAMTFAVSYLLMYIRGL